MRKLFCKSNASFQDESSLALLRYLSNCMDITMSLESANHLNCPLKEVATLFPTTRPCKSCSIPAQWLSPLTSQWLKGSLSASSTDIKSQMMVLAETTHQWLATFLDGDSQVRVPTKEVLGQRSRLRQKIESFPPASKTSNSETDAMYECCRWAALLLLTVEKLRIPIYLAAKQVRIQPRLTRRLRMADLTNLWGVHKGLLFWVTVVCNFAKAGQCLPLLCTTLLARFSQEIAMLGCCDEVAVKPLKRLKGLSACVVI